MRKGDGCLACITGSKGAPGGSYEGVYHLLIDLSLLLIALALYRPVVSIDSLGDEVDTGVTLPYLISCGELVPEPHLLELITISWVGT